MQYVRPFRGVVLSVLFGVALLFVGCDSGGVNGGNQPPTVDIAVSSSTVDVGTQVVLDGSGSSDPDGGTLSYSWSLNTPSGSQASLSDASVVQPTFTPDVAGDYTATLEVSDGDATRSASTTITAESAQASTTELSGTISSDSTLTADRNYLVTGPLTVADGAMLTIEPGVHLPFESGAGLYINSNSVLDADGTSSEPITMTATNGNKQAGWWEGVFIFSAEPNNLLNYVEIRHTGSGSPNSIGEEAGVAHPVPLHRRDLVHRGGHGGQLDSDDQPRRRDEVRGRRGPARQRRLGLVGGGHGRGPDHDGRHHGQRPAGLVAGRVRLFGQRQ